MVRAAAAALLVALGCSGTSKPAPPPPPAPQSRDLDVGIVELQRDLEATVIENYQQLSLGNIEAFADGVAAETALTFFGVAPTDVIAGSSTRAILRDRRLYSARSPTLLTKNLDARVALDGSVGWVYDEISYRVPYMGREASIPIRSTQVYVRDVERWVLAGEHLSYALDKSEVIALAMAGDLSRPGPFTSKRVGSEKLADQLTAWVLELHLKGQLPRGGVSSGAVVIYPDPEAEFRGDGIAGAPTLLEALGSGGGELHIRDRRVVVSASGRVAWLFCNLELETTRNGDAVTIGLRGSYVFQQVDEEWVLEQAHVGLPIEESQLSMRVFGPTD